MRMSWQIITRLRKAGRRAPVAACAAVSVALTVASCSSAGSASPGSSKATGQSVSVQVYSGGGLQAWPVLVAQQEHFFAKNNISAHVVTVNTGPQALAALTSGQLDMVQIDVIQAAPLMAEGHQLGIVMGNNSLDFSLIAGKTVVSDSKTYPANVRALKGRTIGVLALGGVLQDLAEIALQDAGLSKSSVRWTAISSGGVAAGLAALKTGRIDALMTNANYNALFQTVGGRVLLDFSHQTADTASYPQLRALQGITDGGIWASRSWISTHKAAVDGTRRALMEADVWMHNPKNLPALTQIVKAQGGIPANLPADETGTYIKDSLAMVEASYPKSSAQEEMSFARQFGLVKASISVSSYYGSGIPVSEQEVARLAKSTGGA